MKILSTEIAKKQETSQLQNIFPENGIHNNLINNSSLLSLWSDFYNDDFRIFDDNGVTRLKIGEKILRFRVSNDNKALFFTNQDLLKSTGTESKYLFVNSSMKFFLGFEDNHFFDLNILILCKSYMGEFQEAGNYLSNTYIPGNSISPVLELNRLFSTFLLSDNDTLFIALTIGRQPLFLQNFYDKYFNNLVLPEKADGIVLKLGSEKFGTFHVIGLDFLDIFDNLTEKPYCCYDYSVRNPTVIGDFNGDILTFRSGIFYESPDFLKAAKKYQWKFYLNTFFTRYGPVSGGTDRSSGTGSFTDNDYVFHYGAASFLGSDKMKVLLEVEYSSGIDRKLPGIFGKSGDIRTNGLFLRSGIFLPFVSPASGTLNIKHAFFLNFLYADGSAFDSSGQKTEYGFVANGNHDSGGLLLNNVWGFRPYALSLSQGVSNNLSYGFYHSNGAAVANIGYSFSAVSWLAIGFQSWFIFDTSKYDNKKNIFENNSVYKKFTDRYAGAENMLSVKFIISSQLELRLAADVFIPGRIYLINQMLSSNSTLRNLYAIIFFVNVWF